MRDFDINARLSSILQQAYHRRARNLPANLNDIVETLKGDLLKAYPDVPIEVVDDAIVIETLHNPDTQLSPVFFFNAVKKAWFTPKVNRHAWDEDDNRRPDYEEDTIGLIDTCASMLQQMDEAEAKGQAVAKKGEFKGVVIELPAFNARRMYGYLKLRGQLADGAGERFMADALLKVNTDRMRTSHHRLTKEEAQKDPDVRCMAMRLACLDWLKACITQGRKPSDILTPLIDQASYAEYRRTSP